MVEALNLCRIRPGCYMKARDRLKVGERRPQCRAYSASQQRAPIAKPATIRGAHAFGTPFRKCGIGSRCSQEQRRRLSDTGKRDEETYLSAGHSTISEGQLHKKSIKRCPPWRSGN